MLILVAKLSWVHQLIFKRKKINEKKDIQDILTYFPKPDFEICFYHYKKSFKTERPKKEMKIVETVHE